MRNYLFYLLVFSLLLSVASLTGCSNDKIEGIVTDEHGTPLKGVNIQVAKSRFLSTTDNNGHYSIDYAPGSFSLIFTKNGYITNTLPLVLQQKYHFPVETIILHSYSNNTSPKKLAKFVMQTFATEDKNAFVQFAFPNKEMLSDFIRKTRPIEKQEEVINTISKDYKGISGNIISTWEKTYNTGLEKGLDWNAATFENVKYTLKKDNTSEINIYVTFGILNKQYKLRLRSCVRINNRWYALAGVNWRQ